MNNLQDQLRPAVRRGRAMELQQLLSDRTVPRTLVETLVLDCMRHHRPECARLLFDTRADLRSDMVIAALGLGLHDTLPVYERIDLVSYTAGKLALDLLSNYELPLSEQAAAENVKEQLMPVLRRMRGATRIRADEEYRERVDGLLSILEGRYWQDYGGRNPFLAASTALEMVDLLLVGAANNEHGQTDMTRLRSIRPSLRRAVMELLHQHVVSDPESMNVFEEMMTNENGSLSILSGFEEVVLPRVEDFLLVHGRPLQNARNALATFNELATGAIEREYDAGDW